jgi:CBS domain-containing protein
LNVKIDDLMVKTVMAAGPRQSVGSVRETMNAHRISSMPVLDDQARPLGIITSTDILAVEKDQTEVRHVMTKDVKTVPQYGDPSLAARIMRNHHIHHVLVTHEQRVVGILSSFDLLVLIEERRFTAKNAPATSVKGGARKRGEAPGAGEGAP